MRAGCRLGLGYYMRARERERGEERENSSRSSRQAVTHVMTCGAAQWWQQVVVVVLVGYPPLLSPKP